jgi:anaerobic dimethyl sulfoxide reductase subunit B
MPSYGWLLDPKRCIECRACEVACKQWNNVDIGLNVRYRRVLTSESGRFPNLRTQALSMACNHCERPTCAMACPVKAISRRADGTVLIDTNKCVSCRQCENFCPYHAPQFNARTKKMEKCTMCADRIDRGLDPACVAVCPTAALTWGEWSEVSGKGADQVAGFNSPALTRPRIRFVTKGWGQ